MTTWRDRAADSIDALAGDPSLDAVHRQSLAYTAHRLRRDAEWDEGSHPRAADGKFGEGSGHPVGVDNAHDAEMFKKYGVTKHKTVHVSGNTFPVKEQLKTAGAKWSPDEKKWTATSKTWEENARLTDLAKKMKRAGLTVEEHEGHPTTPPVSNTPKPAASAVVGFSPVPKPPRTEGRHVLSREALDNARATHPDARRMSVTTASRIAPDSVIGTHASDGSKILHAHVEDVGATGGDPGNQGYKMHLIVSRAAGRSGKEHVYNNDGQQ